MLLFYFFLLRDFSIASFTPFLHRFVYSICPVYYIASLLLSEEMSREDKPPRRVDHIAVRELQGVIDDVLRRHDRPIDLAKVPSTNGSILRIELVNE